MTETKTTDNNVEIRKFWRHLFGGETGLLHILTTKRAADGETNRSTIASNNFSYPGAADSAASWALDKAGEGREVYFCAHLLTGPRRVKENAGQVRTLWGDLDGAPVPNGGLKPTAVVESSPGRFHAYWRLDNEIPPQIAEDLNRRIARQIGADPSGFDCTQLLRLPGTTNHKYPDKPEVKLLDLDGSRSYSAAELGEMLPKVERPTYEPEADDGEEPPIILKPGAMKVWRGEKPKLKGSGEVDRSATLLRIGRVLFDAGANRSVVVAGIAERDQALGYRKYTGRTDAAQRYREMVAELERNGRARTRPAPEPPPEEAIEIEDECAADVTTTTVTWLWHGRIPVGKLSMFDGDPDLGKSVVTMDIAARVSTGRGFPDGAPCEAGNVLIVNVEDGAGDTIVPRLKAHGADLSRIFLFSSVPDGKGGRRLLDLPGDIGLLENKVVQRNAALLIIDPVLTMLGGDSNKDQDARKALTPVRDMAERTGVAVVAVRHLNKAVGLKAIQRGGGNMGLIGVARAGSFFAEHPDEEGIRVMAPHKSNLAAKPPSLGYRVVNSPVYDTARIEWTGTVDHNADALAAGGINQEEKTALDDAKAFLREELEDGPMAAKQVIKDAADAGVAQRTLYRAKSILGVRSEKEQDHSWTWVMPKPPDKDPYGNVGNDGNLGNVGNVQHTSTENPSYIREGCQGCQGCQDCQPGSTRQPSFDNLGKEKTTVVNGEAVI